MFEFIASVKWLLVEEDGCGDMYKWLLLSLLLTNAVVPPTIAVPFLKLLLLPLLFRVLPKLADSLTDLFLL